MKTRKNLLLIIAVLTIFGMVVQPVSASYTHIRRDYTGYDWSKVYEYFPYSYDHSVDTDTGEIKVSASTTSWYSEWLHVQVGMTFVPNERGDFYFGAAWTLDYKLDSDKIWGTLFSYGVVTMKVIYRLYDEWGYQMEAYTIKTHQASWGNTVEGIYSYSHTSRVHFTSNLYAYRAYKVCVEAYFSYSCGSVSGYGSHPDCELDVSYMKVTSS